MENSSKQKTGIGGQGRAPNRSETGSKDGGSQATKGVEDAPGGSSRVEARSQPAAAKALQTSWLLSTETHLSTEFCADEWPAAATFSSSPPQPCVSAASVEREKCRPPRLRLNTGSQLVQSIFKLSDEEGETARSRPLWKEESSAKAPRKDPPRNNSMRSCGQNYPTLTLSKKSSQPSFAATSPLNIEALKEDNHFLQRSTAEEGMETPFKKLPLPPRRERYFLGAPDPEFILNAATPVPPVPPCAVDDFDPAALVTPVVKPRAAVNAPPTRHFDFDTRKQGTRMLTDCFAQEPSSAKRKTAAVLGHKRSKTETELNLPKVALAEPALNADDASMQLSMQLSRFERDYKVVTVLGNGTHGKVFHVVCVFDQLHYAVKQIRMSPAQPFSARKEAQALAAITTRYECKQFVKYYCSWVEEDCVFICMELCASSLLGLKRRRLPGQFSEEFLRRVIRHVCKALKKIHKDAIVHFDVKPENILVTPTQKIKLSDFTLARNLRVAEDRLSIEEGDCRYMAKELLDDGAALSSPARDYTKCDIFSLGMTVYDLMVGDRLDIPRNGQLWHDLRSDNIPFLETLPGYSSNFKRLVAAMMAQNPATRPSARTILTQHLLHFDKNYERFLKLRISYLENQEQKRTFTKDKGYKEY